MTAEIRLEESDENRLPELLLYLKSAYREDLALSHPDVFRWQFGKERNDGLFNFFITTAEGRIAGTYGYVPVSAHWGGFKERKKIVYGINWTSAPEYASVSWAAVRRLKKQYDGILTLQQTKDTDRITSADGWFSGADIPRFVCVLDKDEADRYTGVDTSSFAVNPCGNYFKPEFSGCSPDWQNYPSMAYGVIRDTGFLKWRYIEHPVFDYRIFTYGPPEAVSVCVVRIQQSSGEFSVNTAKIIDFFHPAARRKDGETLIRSVLGYCADKNCVYIDSVISAAEYRNTLCGLGFCEDKTGVFPSRLTPVQRIKEKFNFLYWARSGSHDITDCLYLTRGDSDTDRAASLHLINNRSIHV